MTCRGVTINIPLDFRSMFRDEDPIQGQYPLAVMCERVVFLDPTPGRAAHLGEAVGVVVAPLNGACDGIGIPEEL